MDYTPNSNHTLLDNVKHIFLDKRIISFEIHHNTVTKPNTKNDLQVLLDNFFAYIICDDFFYMRI